MKKIYIAIFTILFIVPLLVKGQATLPTSFSGSGWQSGMPTGWSHTGLGTDYAANYDGVGGNAGKFDTQGDELIIFFTGSAGTLSYYLGGNGLSGSYIFNVQESTDGTSYSTSRSHTSASNQIVAAPGTAWSLTLNAATRYVKFIFTTKATGNVGIDGVSISAPASTNLFWNGGNATNNTNNIWDLNTTRNWGATSAATFTANTLPGVVWPATGNYTANFSNVIAAAQTISLPATISVMPSSTVIGATGYNFVPSVTQTFSSPITLTNSLTVSPNSGTVFTLSGISSGAGGLSQNGAGTTILSGNNSYTGATTVLSGTLQIGATGSGANSPLGTVATGTSVTSGAVLDLNGFTLVTAEGLALNGTGISAGGALINSSITPASYSGAVNLASNSSIATSGAGSITLSGVVSGSGSLTKIGTGTLISTAVNTYGGGTNLSAGQLTLNPSGNTSLTGIFNLNGGILSTSGITTNRTITFATGSLSENSTIALGTNAHTITFTSAGTFASTKILTVTGWTGTIGACSAGTAGKIFFGNSASGLTASQLEQIRFTIGGVNYPATILSTGQIVPTLKLSITNPGTQTAGIGFNVTVTAVDFDGTPRNVTANTGINLSSGTNTISGTTTGTIASGTNAITISGVVLTAGSNATLSAIINSGSCQLSATSGVFDVNAPSGFLVTFNGNGATSGSMSLQNASTPTAITSNGFSRTGYTFSNWNTLANGSGTTYANGAVYAFDADITLFAQWTPNNNTITFDANGGTGTMPNQTIPTAGTANLTANAYTRTGYTFAGWNSLSDGSGTAYTDGQPYVMGTANVTLFAQWTLIVVTKTYTLISSVADLEIGKKYLIVNKNSVAATSAYALGWQDANNRPHQTNPASLSIVAGPSITTSPATTSSDHTNSYEITLEAGSDATHFYLKDGVNNSYLIPATGSAANNYLKGQLTASNWTITFSAGAAVITNTGHPNTTGRNIIRYNNGSDIFSSYASGQDAVYLYKEVPNVCTSAPSITTQPANASVAIGAMATFSVTATGGALSYQWQVSTDCGANWNNVTNGTGGTTSSYTTITTTLAMNSYLYRVIVSNLCGPSTTSNAANLAISSTSTGLYTEITSATYGWTDQTYGVLNWTETILGNIWKGGSVNVNTGQGRVQFGNNPAGYFQTPAVANPISLTIYARNLSATSDLSNTLTLYYSLDGTNFTSLETKPILNSFSDHVFDVSSLVSNSTVYFKLANQQGSNVIYIQKLTVIISNPPSSIPVNYTWTGTASSYWGAPCNWNPAGVPGAIDNVVLPSTGVINNLILDESRTVTNFSITNNVSTIFTMGPSAVLSINGNVNYGTTVSANLDCASQVRITSISPQTIPPINYGNLDASGGNRTLPNGATVGICSSFNPGSGTYTIPGSTVNYFSSASGWVMLPFTYHNLTFSGTGDFSIGYSSPAIAKSITVMGDFSQTAGTVYLGETSTATAVLNVEGNASITGGTFDMNRISGGTGTFNLKGNLTVGAGASLIATNVANNSFNFTGTGDGTTTALTQTIDFVNATTAQRVNFNVNSGAYVKLINQNLALGTAGTFRVKTGGIFDFGFDGVNGAGTNALNVGIVTGQNSQTFTTESGSTLKITSPYGITTDVASTTAGNVQVSPANRIFNVDGIYHYIGKADQVTGNAIPSAASAKKVIVELQTTNPANDNLTFKSTNGIVRFTAAGMLDIRKGTVIDESGVGFEDGTGATDFGKLTMTGGRYRISRSGTQPALSGTYALDAGVIEFAHTNGMASTIESIRGGATYQYPAIEVTGEDVFHSNGNINLKADGLLTIKNGGTLTSTVNSEQIASVSATNHGVLTIENNAVFKTAAVKGFYGPPDGINPAASVRNDINLNLLPGSTVNYARETTVLPTGALNGNQEITALSAGYPYQNLAISGSGDKTAISGTLKVAGDISKSGALTQFKHNNGTVELSGNITQNITATLPTPAIIFNNLSITNASTIGVDAKSDFGVYRTLSLNGVGKLNLSTGDISLKSDLNNTANVDKITGTAAITYGTGRFIVERFINTGTPGGGVHRRTWQFLSVPVNTTQSIKAAWQEGAVNPADNPNPGYGTRISSQHFSVGTPNGFDQYTAGAGMKKYKPVEDQWDDGPATTGDGISNPNGYMLFVRGDRTVSADNATTPVTLRTRGQLWTGTYPAAPITVGSNLYESIGNPYASAIDLTKVNFSNLTEQVYIWDPTLGIGAAGFGRYRTLAFSPDGHYHVSPDDGLGAYTGIVDFIQSGQAFFVKASPAGGSVQFTEAAKDGGNRLVNRGGTLGADFERLHVNLSVKSADDSKILLDGSLAIFSDQYSRKVDDNDGAKLINSGENSGFKRDGKYISVERMPSPNDKDTLFLQVQNLGVKTYYWQFRPNAMEKAGRVAFLEDKFNATLTPINLGTDSYAAFDVTDNPASAAADRFRIVFQKVAAPTPVKFISVAATRNADRSINVKWKVENEINITGYDIERSADGRSFTGILSSSTTNQNNYAKNDLSPLAQDNYYRIKASGLGGEITYSDIVKVVPLPTKASISVYPNPVENKTAQLIFANQPAGVYHVQVINNLGQVIYNSSVKVSGYNFVYPVELGAKISQGNYEVKVVNGEGKVSTQKIVIN